MAGGRLRPGRWLALLVALALVVLLLALNQLLPGTWPGGTALRGEHGPRPSGPAPAAPREAEGPPRRPESLLPPGEPAPEWPPLRGVRVEVRSATGAEVEGWRLGVGEGGAMDQVPGPDGVLRLQAREAFRDGFRVGVGSVVVSHSQALEFPAGSWSVRLPAGPVPARRSVRDLALEVVGPDGAPIAGARVTRLPEPHVPAPEILTDAQGRASLPHTLERAAVRVEAPGRAGVEAWVTARQGEPTRVVLEPVERVSLRVAGATSLAIHAPDGAPIAAALRVGPDAFEADVPRGALAGAWVLGERARDGGVESFEIPLSDLAAGREIPAPRQVRVRLRDGRGKPVADKPVRAWTAATPGIDGESPTRLESAATTDATGEASLYVPAAGAVTLRVDAAGHAPVERTFVESDGNDVLEWVLDAPLTVPLRVVDEKGAPLVGARWHARATLGSGRLEREGVTGPDGRVDAGPFPPGEVEVFAAAPGRAWGRAAVTARAAMGTVEMRLEPGAGLRLVVEDPLGIPLQGVRVEWSPADGGPPLVEAPAAGAPVTDERGGLVLAHLPLRPLRLRLLREGFRPERIEDVHPGAVTLFTTLVRE